MTIAFEGWLDGLTASGIILSSAIFGLLSLYKSIKLKAKLLSIAGIMIFFVGFLWLGPTVDFLFKLIADNNIEPKQVYVFLSYTSVAPALFFAIYLGSELLMPKYKWLLVGIFVVIGVIFVMFLWFSPNQSFDHIMILETDGLIDVKEIVRSSLLIV